MSDHTPPTASIASKVVRRVTAILRSLINRFPRLSELFDRWLCILDCDGEIYETETEIPAISQPTSTSPRKKARGRDEYAISTTVANLGETPIQVFEDHHLLLVVPAGESRDLPTQGYGEITVGHVPNESFDGEADYMISGFALELDVPLNAPIPEVGMTIIVSGVPEVYTITQTEITEEPHGTQPELYRAKVTSELDPPPGDGGGASDEPYALHTNYDPAAVTVKVTTLRRCKCDVNAYVDDERPIGDDLI